MPTENIDSRHMIQSSNTLPNPFLDNSINELDDDEQLDVAETFFCQTKLHKNLTLSEIWMD